MLSNLRFLTAGESHGKGLIALLEGIPSGLPLSPDDIDSELKRRQQGYGRGGRMKIEQDRASIISGVRWGKTLGSPISLLIENRDWVNWQEGMSCDASHKGSIPPVSKPRPGHADLTGIMKYNHEDIRNILERSSARETAARVAAGAVARKFLSEFGIFIGSYVVRIGSAAMIEDKKGISPEIFSLAEASRVRCPDEETTDRMAALIDEAAGKGDTLGGIFKVVISGVPAGLGSHIQWDRRLNARLMMAVSSIQAIKGVEIGLGFEAASRFGSEVMDEIFYSKKTGFYRNTNNAGGIEGGMSNGMPIIVSAAMKPIPTLRKPLRSVDMSTREAIEAAYERSDTCAVPAASVIAEAMAALCTADALLEKCGGDSIDETKRNFDAYREYLKNF
ncbi:MAG TPA: chorismate synthase [Dissulfurispiraceae bacterium]